MLLAKHGYFLRVFELRNKFRHLALKNPKKQNIVRQLSSCINEKYNGFHVISIQYSKKLRKKFKPIDIIYRPVKSLENKDSVLLLSRYIKIIERFWRRWQKIIAWVCLWVLLLWKLFARAYKQKSHVENNYNSNYKNLITFEDSFKSKGDMPMAMYFDFERTAPTDNCFNPEQKNVCYVFCFNYCFSSAPEP